MPRPRTMLIAVAAVLAGAAASGLGDAQADSSTSSTPAATPATIVVNGTSTLTTPAASESTTEQSTYMTALGDAITDAATKATAIATQIGATLGPIENVTETSDTGGDLCQGWFEPLTANRTATSPSSGASSDSNKKRHKKAAAVVRAEPAVAGVAAVRGGLAVLPPTGPVSVPRIGPAVIVDDPDTCSIEADVTVTYDITPS